MKPQHTRTRTHAHTHTHTHTHNRASPAQKVDGNTVPVPTMAVTKPGARDGPRLKLKRTRSSNTVHPIEETNA